MSESLLLHVRTFWEGKLARQVGVRCLYVCLFYACALCMNIIEEHAHGCGRSNKRKKKDKEKKG